MAQAHTHLDVEINLLESGRLTYFHGGRQETLEPGVLAVFWGGIPHQSLEGDEASGWWVTLPIGWVLRWRHAGRLSQSLFAGHFVREPAPTGTFARGDPERLQRWLGDYESADPSLLQALALELEARLTRLAQCLPHTPPKRHRRRRQAEGLQDHLERMTAFLARNYTEDVRSEDIARAARLNVTYAMETFRRGCGMTLADYLARLRLAHAQRLLLTTDRKVLDIALEAGFNSSSAFYANFKKYVGQDPRTFRQQAATQPPKS